MTEMEHISEESSTPEWTKGSLRYPPLSPLSGAATRSLIASFSEAKLREAIPHGPILFDDVIWDINETPPNGPEMQHAVTVRYDKRRVICADGNAGIIVHLPVDRFGHMHRDVWVSRDIVVPTPNRVLGGVSLSGLLQALYDFYHFQPLSATDLAEIKQTAENFGDLHGYKTEALQSVAATANEEVPEAESEDEPAVEAPGEPDVHWIDLMGELRYFEGISRRLDQADIFDLHLGS